MTAPPIEWFRNPGLTEPTPHTVLPPVEIDGKQYRRVMGHLATWETTHVGLPGQNVRPPRSPSDYAHFHVGSAEVTDDDGNLTRVPCGHLTCDTGHAGLEASAQDAAKFYDNTGTLAASVCAGEDDIGIWYSGVVEPELPELTLRRFSGCSQSGDWRPINGKLDLVASLSVPTPGFPIPRSRVASAGEPTALVAANIVPNPQEPEEAPMSETPIAKGDYVELADGFVGQVVETGDKLVVELTASADEVKPASEEQALAASAARTERQRVQSLEAKVDRLTAALEQRDIAERAQALLADVEV